MENSAREASPPGTGYGRTHHPIVSEWAHGYDQTGKPTLYYVGPTKGWYKPTPWSSQRSFDSNEESDDFESVYIVHAPATGRVKIGRSRQVYRRFSHIRAMSGADVELVAILPEESELNLHQRFADRRITGEWFDESVLDDLRADGTIT